MKRFVASLRAGLLPLLAIAGVTLVVLGVVEWWRFHRALFVEDLDLIAELAGEDGGVSYRRQGETNPRNYRTDEKNREPIPWSVPFVGRVEFAEVLWGRPRPGQHRALAAPDLRCLVGLTTGGQFGGPAPGRLDTVLPLGRPLPTLPQPQLRPEDLLAPWPTGKTLGEEERRSIAERVAAALESKPSSRSKIERTQTTPLFHPERRSSWSLRLQDGERKFDFDSDGFTVWGRAANSASGHVLLCSRETVQAFCDDDGTWILALACDRDLPETIHRFSDEIDDRYAGSRASGFDSWSGDVSATIGDKGENVRRIDRLDASRLYVEAEVSRGEEGDLTKLRAIVREDLDCTIERWETRATGSEKTHVLSHVLRLEREPGEVVFAERISGADLVTGDDLWAPLPEPPSNAERSLVAVDFDPDYSEALFDPRSYLPDWPERRQLPFFRTYRALLLAGGALLLTALSGALLTRRARDAAAPGERRPAPRFRLAFRFGFATLFGFALLAISLAGWIKQRVDEAKEQLVLLGKLDEEGYGYEIERRSPGFPWMFFSTDALPLDAPPVRLRLSEDPAPAALEETFRTWPEIDYGYYSFEGRGDADERFRRPVVGANVEALGGSVPTLRDVDPFLAPSSPFPIGERLQGEALAHVVESAIAAWHAAGHDRPTRYLVRQEIYGDVEDDRVTARDGVRWRIGDGDPGSDVEWMELGDGRSRRRFIKELDPPPWEVRIGWSLVFQRPLRPSERPTTASVLPSAPEREWDYLDNARAGFCDADLEGPGRQPMHEAGLPRAPYCLPPCIGPVWAPPLDEMLHRIERSNVVAAERIDANRVRFDFDVPSDRSSDQPTEEYPAFIRWSVIARSDLNWLVERCEYVDEIVRTLPIDVEWSEDGNEPSWKTRTARRRREIAVHNTLRSDDESFPYVGAAFRCREFEGTESERTVDASVRYAVDLSPSFSDEVFDRPTVDWPDPPARQLDRSLPWPWVTSVIGVLCVAGGPIVRRLSRRTSRAPEAPADEGGP